MQKCIIVSVALVILSGIAMGQVPQLINYQGLLMDPATGQPVPDGTYEMVFSIYDVPTNGSAIWTETKNVQTQNGLYDVLLGSTTPLSSTILSGPEKYLGIKVGEAPEMTPRKRIVSVAYAIVSATADSLGDKAATEYATKIELSTSDGDPPNQGSNRMSWDNLRDVPDGFADGVDNIGSGGGGWVDDGTVVRLETGTDSVGIGTTSPGAILDVRGSAVFNEDGGDFDFYIKGDNDPNLFSINASQDKIGIGKIPGAGGKLDVAGTVEMTGFKLTTGPSDGYVLTSDADGIGTWQPPSGGFTLPFSGSTSSSDDAFSVTTTGIGRAGGFRINNSSSEQEALHGYTDGSGAAVFGNNSGTGRAGDFHIYNVNNSETALHARTEGTGRAGRFVINNTSNPSDAIYVSTNGGGEALRAETFGTGRAADIIIDNETNSRTALRCETNGTGNAGNFNINNVNNSEPALLSETNGTGNAGKFVINNTSNAMSAIAVNTNGMGKAGNFLITNTDNPEDVIRAHTSGLGPAGDFGIENSNNNNTVLEGKTVGMGSAGNFQIDNTSNNQPALHGWTNGSGAAVYGNNSGTGIAGGFGIYNVDNDQNALDVFTNGTGRAAHFSINNITNSSDAIKATTIGTGKAAAFKIDNASNIQHVLHAETNGGGISIVGYTNGTGIAGFFEIDNASSNKPALEVNTNGNGPSIAAYNYGTGNAGKFEIDNTGNVSDAIQVSTNGGGEAIRIKTFGTGRAADIFIDNEDNNRIALSCGTNGTGTVLLANHHGSSGDIAIFQSGSSNQARIDKTGKGFFNGGTQTGGADLAEALQVLDEIENYEPADVLIISTNHDSKFEKSNKAYSTLVVGVYATKPGVLLCDRHIDDRLDDTIPVGIVGIIPTKVSGENGSIKRGDLLVTSNTPGHAMKGTDREQMLGAIIGKALENFEGSGTGIIKVLVNVK